MPIDDKALDRLFQLPLDQFTAERNALAKASGPQAAGVKALSKPPVAAWAVNQVYWRDRKTYDALVEAARDLRQVHTSILAGKKGDLRTTGKLHEEMVEAAAKSALGILKSEGQPATDATKQAIVTTMRALPADEAPGRLTRTLQPGGFEMLAGVPIKAGARVRVAPEKPPAPEKSSTKADPAAAAKAREAAAEAARNVRLAEHAARREEFEAARAAREAEKAARDVATAREAFDEAKRALEEAEEKAEEAAKTRKAAEKRAKEAETELEDARTRQREADRRATR